MSNNNATKMIPAADAMLKVMKSWGIFDIFGLVGGSINSTLAALAHDHNEIKYIQVRHEQVGALCAAATAKLTGEIGVCFGSAGPGAVNLLDGLYDAKEDHVPVLALVGQVTNTNINYNYFQEMPETPIFADVSCYNRVVMTPESLPHVIDQAIHAAYENQGVAVVIIPNNFGFIDIPDLKYSTASDTYKKPQPEPVATDTEVKEFLQMVKAAKFPVFHVGRGIRNSGNKMVELAKKLQIPIIIDGLAKGLILDDYVDNLGTSNRAASKPADEILSIADLVIAIGGDFPFANTYYARHPFKYIQVDNKRLEIGRHHNLDLGIWSDATVFIDKVLKLSQPAASSNYYQAAGADMQNWKEYLDTLYNAQGQPLTVPPIYKEINAIANDQSIFSIDVGNNIIDSFRFLDIKRTNKFIISALFATMGFGLPGAIAAQVAYPKRQVFNIAGDGAFAMVMQDLVDLVKYKLPVINVITQNDVLGFIKYEQQDLPMPYAGIDLVKVDFAKIAEAMGVKSAIVHNTKELKQAMQAAKNYQKAGKPFLIDARVIDQRGLPVEDLLLKIVDGKLIEEVSPSYEAHDPSKKPETLRAFFDAYGGYNLQPLAYFLKQYHVKL